LYAYRDLRRAADYLAMMDAAFGTLDGTKLFRPSLAILLERQALITTVADPSSRLLLAGCYSYRRADDDLEICGLYTREGHRNGGYARTALRQAVEYLRLQDAQRVFLVVRMRNGVVDKKLDAFYRAERFIPTGRVFDYEVTDDPKVAHLAPSADADNMVRSAEYQLVLTGDGLRYA
jgi:ribosomal protein S18 acetylase RimI-like enzyme